MSVSSNCKRNHAAIYAARYADPAKRQRRNDQRATAKRMDTMRQAQERVVVLEELVEVCQKRAVECDDAREERGWLWAARWVRSQMEREQEKVDARRGVE